jgi:hypothetical protein
MSDGNSKQLNTCMRAQVPGQVFYRHEHIFEPPPCCGSLRALHCRRERHIDLNRRCHARQDSEGAKPVGRPPQVLRVAQLDFEALIAILARDVFVAKGRGGGWGWGVAVSRTSELGRAVFDVALPVERSNRVAHTPIFRFLSGFMRPLVACGGPLGSYVSRQGDGFTYISADTTLASRHGRSRPFRVRAGPSRSSAAHARPL